MSSQDVLLVKRKRRALTKPQAAAVKAIVHKQAENKFASFYMNTAGEAQKTATVGKVSIIPQGEGHGNRQGNLIYVKALYLRAFLYNTFDFDNMYGYVRVIVFQWHGDTTLAEPSVGEVLMIGTAGEINYTSQYNIAKRKSYSILMDKTVVLNSVKNTDGVTDTYHTTTKQAITFKKKLVPKRKQLSFTADDGTKGFNQVYYFVLGQYVTPSEQNYQFTWNMIYDDL